MTTTTTIQDLPDAVLAHIISLLSDTRTRNSTSLVSLKWRALERLTRSHLSLRGNIRHLLFHLPTCFSAVSHLDISSLSPWGISLHPNIISTATNDHNNASLLLAHRLRLAFPAVTSLTLYSRYPCTLSLLSPLFDLIEDVKLIRWHQRPNNIPLGSDFFVLFQNCGRLKSVDLSSFYYWTEDLMSALEAHPRIGVNLVVLNLLNFSLSEGFKSQEVVDVTRACPNLRDFRVGCVFYPRYIGFLGDDALSAISSNCKELRVLHLADIAQGDREFDDQGFCREDAGLTVQGIVSFFTGLMLVEELVLDVWRNVRGSWVCLEALASRCPNLRSLELGCFHGICKAIESHLDGIALCQGLESLTIKNSADLTDFGLIAIGRGCSKLTKFEVIGCKKITMRGLRTMVCLLKRTLVEVKISGCKYLDASASLKAVEPIRGRIRRLHIDCVWNGEKPEYEEEVTVLGVDYNHKYEGKDDEEENSRMRKRTKVSWDIESWFMGNMEGSTGNGYITETWGRLEFLSLWIGVGELLTPLANAGLEDCPKLREIHIKVEGDCRERPKPSQGAFGISSLGRYPMLSKMKLDCGDTIGYALTAPSGHMDLSLWERWFLTDLRSLRLNELDYWPPQDREVNQRSLSLPAAGLLQECDTLRKLFIHGTTHEHFMLFFLKIPNLRDVQLRGDYYPAPENDMSTEMRVDSCCRFEYKLNERDIPD
ncbi:F-box/LRR-repeat MAX2 homolog A-like [Chenopodium quinoa]|uniref:F-box/LRR-repeat MAX2 homolog A-like n=1 Tax=Chenopodium quinoa TaxID=63459 RepID=UPI000B7869A3|nr:F-box/LRR-repeat MAX2 homolog A-like [Chenopodium quinoa]XP_021730656.1 F-box/LRR-repeat MAX2 homolog A-like [Chenopodium quinoa]XP_021730657.1 F-box/LRR-repeat MAX2 homolog A-like [Chenopodium quinoa]XP_021730658.1 F-box/LRR-repeat MAX2 homolog A-like [Chenopodium quinoa]XP_021730660.1 F-box/LRR-repeat MAX2 homolog A-like [Chenopodium quinoa]XP_021730661.1 F-box/LRR-repeat MAX2 homolog A-like [Chenopodium quinoa]XP_021730662.1 F-box/LRR-repeat MAX2 homolog A-like [Chenopodium quinoa]